MPADARGEEQPRAGRKIQYVPCQEKDKQRRRRRQLYCRDGRTKFSHENLFLLKKTKARKSSISFTGKKKKQAN